MSDALVIGARELLEVVPKEYEEYVEAGGTFFHYADVLNQIMTGKKST